MERNELIKKVREAQNGDIAAFRDLFYAYCRPLTNYALRLIGNREDAEDIVQEAMIKAYGSLSSLRHPEQFDVWIYRIVTNKTRDRYDRKKREIGSYEEAEVDNLVDKTAGRDEEARIVKDLLERLPERLKTACILHYSEGFSCRETAKIMRTTEGTIRVLLYQARQKLKGMLRKGEDL